MSKEKELPTIKDFQRACELKYGPNNKRRYRYNKSLRRGIRNKDVVAARQCERACKRGFTNVKKKRGRYKHSVAPGILRLLDILKLTRRCTREKEIQNLKVKKNFTAVPYDFDCEKNALIVISN